MRRWILGFTCYVKDYIVGLHKELVKYGMSDAAIYESRNNWKVKWHSRNDIKSMYGFLYKDANLFLARKRAIFEDACDYFDQNPPYSRVLKLSKEQVVEIRTLYSSGNNSFATLAEKYSVGRTTIESVLKHRIASYE
jgi:hypothetical protein